MNYYGWILIFIVLLMIAVLSYLIQDLRKLIFLVLELISISKKSTLSRENIKWVIETTDELSKYQSVCAWAGFAYPAYRHNIMLQYAIIKKFFGNSFTERIELHLVRCKTTSDIDELKQAISFNSNKSLYEKIFETKPYVFNQLDGYLNVSFDVV